jgi:lysosomal acid lipase/cholesteryl ester hydrolase
MGNNLGFELALKGYDVWLTNSRGNRYTSNKHVSMAPTSNEFWKFSWDQKIKYDLPATINYILKETNSETVGYVGHSQGTLIMFGLMSESEEMSKKIKPFIALAPVSSLGNVKSPIKYLANRMVMSIGSRLNGRFSITSWFTRLFAKYCPSNAPAGLCTNLVFVIVGYNPEQLDVNRLEVYFSHTPAGTSWRNLMHFGQNIRDKRFAKFDFGNNRENMLAYGTIKPPLYPVWKINNPYIALHYSQNDLLATPEDVAVLKRYLTEKPLIDDYIVPHDKWNHLDFIWGKDAGIYVNSRVEKLLNQYTDKKN